MTSNQAQSSFLSELRNELQQLWSTLTYSLSGIGPSIRNQLRRVRRLKADYVVIPLSGSLPERDGPPRGFLQRRLPLPSPPLTMERLNRQLQAVADAENVRGVVFIFQGLSLGLASIQSLRRAIGRLQAAGKDVVVFTPLLDLPHFYAAARANRIVVPPSSRFEAIGLRIEAIFMKDALNRIGIEADVVQISPFKTAYNEIGESDITPEQEQQLNWILDDAYEQITTDIAADRKLDLSQIRDLIDSAPFSASRAQEVGLVDDIAYEDSLSLLLPSKRPPKDENEERPTQGDDTKRSVSESGSRAKLITWPEASAIMLEKRRRSPAKYIGVVSVEGTITMGASRNTPLPIPLISGNSSGERTLSNLLRQAEKDRRLAALVVQIDSGGGSALASDLIWRQIERIARRIPVVTFMGNMAASGGYYIAAASHHIVSQPLTLTGSIGVVTLHISTKGLFELMSVKRVALQRGRRANINSDLMPLTEEERQILWSEITETYQRFLDIVASGRKLEPKGLKEICDGRVWTGHQALERELVDSHGDFHDAILKAAELAGLSLDDSHAIAVRNLFPVGSGHVLPKALEEPAEMLNYFGFDQLAHINRKPLTMIPVQITLH